MASAEDALQQAILSAVDKADKLVDEDPTAVQAEPLPEQEEIVAPEVEDVDAVPPVEEDQLEAQQPQWTPETAAAWLADKSNNFRTLTPEQRREMFQALDADDQVGVIAGNAHFHRRYQELADEKRKYEALTQQAQQTAQTQPQTQPQPPAQSPPDEDTQLYAEAYHSLHPQVQDRLKEMSDLDQLLILQPHVMVLQLRKELAKVQAQTQELSGFRQQDISNQIHSEVLELESLYPQYMADGSPIRQMLGTRMAQTGSMSPMATFQEMMQAWGLNRQSQAQSPQATPAGPAVAPAAQAAPQRPAASPTLPARSAPPARPAKAPQGNSIEEIAQRTSMAYDAQKAKAGRASEALI
jgi:hypothetical protein